MKDIIKGYTKDQKIFKAYILKKFLGEGSYGQVFLVENQMKEPYALKVLHKGDLRETRGANSVMNIRSERLVRIEDYGKTVSGKNCLLMEYLPLSLEKVLREDVLDEERARGYFIEILKGLKVLEEHRILHRDIKPDNLFVQGKIIKIGDFGTVIYEQEKSVMNESVGTVIYRAPESFYRKYGFSVDRWAAAVIFYRMLTGHFIFVRNRFNVKNAIIRENPTLNMSPRKYRPFFKKCFQKKVEHRYKTTQKMLEAIENIPGNEEKVFLRSKPIESSTYFYKIFRLDKRHRPIRYVKNDFEDNRNGTVTDHATDRMWQKSGSEIYMKYTKAQTYIRSLNQKRFAGYRNWRLPTVEELISLLEREKQSNKLYIDPMFDKKQDWCWSADKYFSDGCHVNFNRGYVHYDDPYSLYVRAVRKR